MQPPFGPRSLWRRHRRGRFRGDRRAVAAVIGTLLALLVFLSIFGIFLTQYLPLWMTDNESQFSITVSSQFAQMKHDVDLLVLDGQAGHSVVDPITMRSEGVPVFAQPTQGILTFSTSLGLYTNISFPLDSIGPQGTRQDVPNFYQNASTGIIRMYLPDRYFTPIQYTFEQDAVISSSPTGTGEVMLFTPSVSFSHTGTNTSLSMVLFRVQGNDTSSTSTGTDQVYTTLLGTQSYSSESANGIQVNITMETTLPCAWARFYNTTLSANPAGSTPGSPYQSPFVFVLPAGTDVAKTPPTSSQEYNPSTCQAAGPTTPMEVYVVVPNVNDFSLTTVLLLTNVGVGNAPT